MKGRLNLIPGCRKLNSTRVKMKNVSIGKAAGLVFCLRVKREKVKGIKAIFQS